MTLLDAYALVAFLVGGPAAVHVRALLREGDVRLATANLAEALDVSQRVYGQPIERALDILEPLFAGPIRLIPLDLAIARRAAAVRAQHYDRVKLSISLADAVLVASASGDDRIATADPAVLTVASREGVGALALPEQG